jgi:hypothetical protein
VKTVLQVSEQFPPRLLQLRALRAGVPV